MKKTENLIIFTFEIDPNGILKSYSLAYEGFHYSGEKTNVIFLKKNIKNGKVIKIYLINR